jgi:DNA helicase II / ATP-dependent DNA helicase PcrA
LCLNTNRSTRRGHEDFLKYLSLLGQFDLKSQEGYENEDAVQVTTIHQSKGKEFSVVFIVGVATNTLPLKYQVKEFYVTNDFSKGISVRRTKKSFTCKKRLFYVAMTRAQHHLFITYARRYGQNVRETKPSVFLNEISVTNNPLVNLIPYDGRRLMKPCKLKKG